MTSIHKPGDILTLFLLVNDTSDNMTDDNTVKFDDCNIDIVQVAGTHGVYYGSPEIVGAAVQGAASPIGNRAAPGAIITFRHLNISTLFFKAQTTGETLYAIITGTLE
jgi:hypothetical protein